MKYIKKSNDEYVEDTYCIIGQKTEASKLTFKIHKVT